MSTSEYASVVGRGRRPHGGSVPAPAAVVGSRRRVPPVLAWRVLLALALLAAALAALLPATRSSVPAPARTHRSGGEALLSLPLDARAPVSAAIGADSPAYRVRQAADGLQAQNPAQGMRASFERSGVAVSSGGTRLALRLLGVGYGSALGMLAPVAPRADSDRVTYAHPGLSEWYANGPLGLEQGFTVARAPAGRAAGPLTLAIALSGNARAALEEGAQSVTFSRAGKPVLRYSGLSASDARGRALHAWLALEGGRLLLRVDAAGARYPLRIDPFVQQGEKLTGKEETGEGELGASVALSANGETALIGGPADNKDHGAAWVFTRSGSTWTQQGEKLTGEGETGEGEFGAHVALSANGNLALIGAPDDNGEVGAAWTFKRLGGNWSQVQKLGGEEEVGKGSFGSAVALSEDGETALVGGPGDEGADGAAWVFVRIDETFLQRTPKLTGGGEEAGPGVFGWSVALAGDGETALVGAPNDSPGDKARAGGVWVFTREGESWSQQGKALTGGDGSYGYFGTGVALSADGNTALIGASGGGLNKEPAFVFTRSGTKWKEQAKLNGSGDTDESNFGDSVALSAEGDTALVGGFQQEDYVGAVWMFTRSGATWSQEDGAITGAGGSGQSNFGDSMALSSNGKIALVGGAGDNSHVGAAWVFTLAPIIETGSATEVTTTSGRLNATVNPNGEAVTACSLEYGTTASYGKTASCSPSPGSGESPVAVSAALTGLSTDTTYHFRVSATNGQGTSTGADRTFTTLTTSVSGETKEEKKPAEARDGELSAKASEGTGRVTVGPYGEDIGGAPLPKSAGKYFDVYRAAASTFKTIEIKDCELGGGRTIWWETSAGTWEPISEPPAVYSEGKPPCVTVTITESTRPSVAELTGTRFGTRFGELPGALEYGKCAATKDGYYAEGKCAQPDVKKGVPKGKYEWYASPVACYPKKHGYYEDGKCEREDAPKGKPKGKFEVGGSAQFSATGGVTKLEIESVGTLECATSASMGEVSGAKAGTETITFRGCELGKTACFSQDEAASTIETFPLEALIEDEGEAVDSEVFPARSDPKEPVLGYPIMAFTCGTESYTLQGGFRGPTTGPVNAMSATSETTFGAHVGEQELQATVNGKAHKTTITATFKVTRAQEIEIDTSPRGTGG